MRPSRWQAVVLALAALTLASILEGVVESAIDNGSHGVSFEPAHPPRFDVVRITRITQAESAQPSLHVGDLLVQTPDTLAERLRYLHMRPGDRFVFRRLHADGSHDDVTLTTVFAPTNPVVWLFDLMRLALVVVGAIVAIRRPDAAEARALAELFIGLALTLETEHWVYLPAWVFLPMSYVNGFAAVWVAFAALRLACIFPHPSARGIRRVLERANPFLCIFGVALAWTSTSLLFLREYIAPPVEFVNNGLGVITFTAIAVALVGAYRVSTGADRRRVQWVVYTIALAFLGPLVKFCFYLAGIYDPRLNWLLLTLLAAPFGFAYAILRHRVVDIGFVVNRALVFATVSGIIVITFIVLEWALANVFVRVSKTTSTSLELALALFLGFSLRSIHAKVDRVVDDLFFRARHDAERALRTFAREVAYITDPRIAIARAHAELLVRAGASGAAIYLVDGEAAIRVDPGESSAPDRVAIDDPALVRMRATRGYLALRHIASSLEGEQAFPMCVRDAISGAFVLGPKSNGEAYAPDELATIETVALALGNALDALQTAALKAEIARVLLDGAPVETLRRTVDPAAWVRIVAAQPAGSSTGLGE